MRNDTAKTWPYSQRKSFKQIEYIDWLKTRNYRGSLEEPSDDREYGEQINRTASKAADFPGQTPVEYADGQVSLPLQFCKKAYDFDCILDQKTDSRKCNKECGCMTRSTGEVTAPKCQTRRRTLEMCDNIADEDSWNAWTNEDQRDDKGQFWGDAQCPKKKGTGYEKQQTGKAYCGCIEGAKNCEKDDGSEQKKKIPCETDECCEYHNGKDARCIYSIGQLPTTLQLTAAQSDTTTGVDGGEGTGVDCDRKETTDAESTQINKGLKKILRIDGDKTCGPPGSASCKTGQRFKEIDIDYNKLLVNLNKKVNGILKT